MDECTHCGGPAHACDPVVGCGWPNAQAWGWLSDRQLDAAGRAAQALAGMGAAVAMTAHPHPTPLRPMTAAEWADAQASADLATLWAAATDADPGTLLVDGSQYSPSWRVLAGGDAVWSMVDQLDAYGDDADVDVHALLNAYTDALDAGTDALGAHWDDGILWTNLPTRDDDARGIGDDDGHSWTTAQAGPDRAFRVMDGRYSGTGRGGQWFDLAAPAVLALVYRDQPRQLQAGAVVCVPTDALDSGESSAVWIGDPFDGAPILLGVVSLAADQTLTVHRAQDDRARRSYVVAAASAASILLAAQVTEPTFPHGYAGVGWDVLGALHP